MSPQSQVQLEGSQEHSTGPRGSLNTIIYTCVVAFTYTCSCTCESQRSAASVLLGGLSSCFLRQTLTEP